MQLLRELRALLSSFPHAIRGLGVLCRTQRNAWFHALASVAVVALAIVTKRTPVEWGLLAAALGLVWSAEALNTAIENLANRVTIHPDPLIRDAKDIAAAGVLLAALMSIALAVAAFWRNPLAWLTDTGLFPH